jgi:PAS domain S-box-containing protein
MKSEWLRVLLIEDDIIDQIAFQRAIREQNLPYNYAVASSVTAAVVILGNEEFDVVISDFALGDGNLFDIMDTIVQKNIPIIVTTGIGDERTAVKAIKGGADDYIIKDNERNYLNILATTIEKAIEKKSSVIERKRAKEALLRSEEKFRAITSSAQDGIILLDCRGCISFWNNAAEHIFAYRSKEVLGQEVYALLAPSRYYEAWHKSINYLETTERVLLTGKTIELTACHKSGREFPIELTISYFELQYELFITVIIRDITQRKQVELELNKALKAAEAADHTKSEFLANMSHEIRTPMTGIISMAELLLDSDLDRQQQEFAQTIFDSGHHLLAVINDILDVAKIESGTLTLTNTNFELNPFLSNLIRLISLDTSKKKLTFRTIVDPEIPSYLNCDPLRLRQILLNLITNAVKYTDHGQVSLHISMEEEKESIALIRFAVTDSGIGISQDNQDKLFQPFFQIDTSITRRHGGSGLGLVICKRLAEAMGGAIKFASTFGQGSTFCLLLPSSRSTSELYDCIKEKEPGTLSDNQLCCYGTSLTAQAHPVLLVDDDPVAGKVVQFQLNKLGCSVQLVISGEDAIDAALNNDYAVIFMDCHMPGMDGFQATRSIREAELALERHTPIIAVTARAMEGDREICLNSGMDDYISKPVELPKLMRILDHWIP